MCDAWFVVSIDALEMPRIVFTGDEGRCEKEADLYWSNVAADGEEVLVVCEHAVEVHEAMSHSVE